MKVPPTKSSLRIDPNTNETDNDSLNQFILSLFLEFEAIQCNAVRSICRIEIAINHSNQQIEHLTVHRRIEFVGDNKCSLLLAIVRCR